MAEGFRLSEMTHGVCCLKQVGDGGSSVMSIIWQSVPYGSCVEKIECAIYAVKHYQSRLEQLVKDHLQFRGKEGLTKKVIQ